MEAENDSVRMEHQLITQDDKGYHTFPLERSTYEIGKYFKLPIRLKTLSPLVAPHHATLVRIGQGECFHYQLIASYSQEDSHKYKLLVNGNPIQTHDLQDGDTIEFAPGISATYHYARVEPLSVFPEVCILRDYGFEM
jgi:pSer/pThr/pTyr-binding forkhead associated (FHA) protein